jgi:superfamily II DNA/RNA helicase
VHGDLGQGAREQALRAFRNGKVDVLVATDVAARGIDVEGVTHVVNYQCPEDEKTYVHRIGRTGRAGAEGTAVTLVDWDDMPALEADQQGAGPAVPRARPRRTRPPPHLYLDLDIPPASKGTLPRADRTRAGLDAEELEDLGETGESQMNPFHAPRLEPVAVVEEPNADERVAAEAAPKSRSRSRTRAKAAVAPRRRPRRSTRPCR